MSTSTDSATQAFGPWDSWNRIHWNLVWLKLVIQQEVVMQSKRVHKRSCQAVVHVGLGATMGDEARRHDCDLTNIADEDMQRVVDNAVD
jgi:hypothetical protein